MKDSSRWLLLVALIALVISTSGSIWTVVGLNFGGKPVLVLILLGLALWMIKEGRPCRCSGDCTCGRRDTSDHTSDESDDSPKG